jgi:hypothetical protein
VAVATPPLGRGHDAIVETAVNTGWMDPRDEAKNRAWVRAFSRDLYADTGGVPVPGDAYAGAFINHPDPEALGSARRFPPRALDPRGVNFAVSITHRFSDLRMSFCYLRSAFVSFGVATRRLRSAAGVGRKLRRQSCESGKP